MLDPRVRQAFRFVTAALVAIGVLGACAHNVTRRLVRPGDVATLDARSPFLKAHMAGGRVYLLSDWRVEQGSAAVLGSGSLLDANRVVVDSGMFRLPIDSVLLFETNVVTTSGPAVAMTVMFGVTAAIAGFCATHPKSCFGSCPTIYAPGPTGEPVLQAEAFSSSIAPALEATDIDMLLHTKTSGRDYHLRLTNEAFETHVIRSLNLLAVRRPAGGRVYLDGGDFRQTRGSIAPASCTAAEGDCLAAVIDADGAERFSVTDSTDLAVREHLDLRFDDVPAGDIGIVVVSRQTLLTTYLIYQALAWMGRDAGRWLASLERGGGPALDNARGVGAVLGNIEVLVQDSRGDWIAAGGVGETGPIAADTRLVRLPPSGGAPLHVRLQLTRGLWRLDQIALTAVGAVVEPIRIAPSKIGRDGRDDAAALESLIDPARTLTTMRGDAWDITYHLPQDPADYELFVEATGYYLEWMREEWLAEENPLRAAQLFLDPASAMRSLAPRFKQQESMIENLFWNSRYVRPNR